MILLCVLFWPAGSSLRYSITYYSKSLTAALCLCLDQKHNESSEKEFCTRMCSS